MLAARAKNIELVSGSMADPVLHPLHARRTYNNIKDKLPFSHFQQGNPLFPTCLPAHDHCVAWIEAQVLTV